MGICPTALYHCLLRDLDDLPALNSASGHPDELMGAGASSWEVAAQRIRFSLLKKFSDDESGDTERAAYELWSTCNDRCKDWSPTLENSGDELLYGEFLNSVWQCIGPLDGIDSGLTWKKLRETARLGPGVSIGQKNTDMYSKLFGGNLSSTSPFLYQIYTGTHPSPTWQLSEISRAETKVLDVVEGSNLSFVPKTRDIRRAICVEPTLNMFFQLALGDQIMEMVWKRFKVRLETQPDLNRNLARLGSMGHPFCTIDLKSASDTIALGLVNRALHGSRLLGMIHQLRSSVTRYKGETIPLHMVSSMGNGFTFPLQTMLFLCAVEAAYRVSGVSLHWEASDRGGWAPGNFGVFGDDIVVHSNCYRNTVRLLGILGFTVNSTKSFHEGLFRESCGHEYYDGVMVRGVYIKTLKTEGSVYVAINRLNDWSARTSIPLPRTIKYLLGFCRRSFVPFAESDYSGIKVPRHLATHSLRWVRRYQSLGYYALETASSALIVKDSGVILGGRSVLAYNPNGLLLAFLSGALRDGTIGLRPWRPRFRRRLRVTPNWDSHESVLGYIRTRDEWRRWVTTVEENLTA